MKTAEEWNSLYCTKGHEDLVELIRAIQDDAREQGLKDFAGGEPTDAEKERAETLQSYHENAFSNLHAAGMQMVIATSDPRSMNQWEIQTSRDNATEHRRIAEAYIALAQAMKEKT